MRSKPGVYSWTIILIFTTIIGHISIRFLIGAFRTVGYLLDRIWPVLQVLVRCLIFEIDIHTFSHRSRVLLLKGCELRSRQVAWVDPIVHQQLPGVGGRL